MRRGTFVWLAVLLLLLGACAPSSAEEEGGSASDATPTSGEAGQPEVPNEILTFVREGGVAGFCDTLVVSREEAQWQDCVGRTAVMPLEEETQRELLTLAEQYGSFEEETEDNPGGADSLRRAVRFNGVGEQRVTEEVEVRLNEIATGLLSQMMQVGPTPTR